MWQGCACFIQIAPSLGLGGASALRFPVAEAHFSPSNSVARRGG